MWRMPIYDKDLFGEDRGAEKISGSVAIAATKCWFTMVFGELAYDGETFTCEKRSSQYIAAYFLALWRRGNGEN
jgi:hypothetical protein